MPHSVLYSLEVYSNIYSSYLDKLTILNNKLLQILQKTKYLLQWKSVYSIILYLLDSRLITRSWILYTKWYTPLISAIYTVGQKQDHRLMTIILSIVNWLKKIFHWRFFGNFAVKWISKIPSHLAYVATLLCETLMSAKQAINDKNYKVV